MNCAYLVVRTNVKLIEMSLWNFCGDHCSCLSVLTMCTL